MLCALEHRNLTARQLDALTKELAVPLGKLVKGFPAVSQLHEFEQALLLLTLGPQRYERHVDGVDSLRKSLLEVCHSVGRKILSPVLQICLQRHNLKHISSVKSAQ